MKKQFSFIAMLLLFLMSSCSTLRTAPETIKEITEKIESKNFTIGVNYANPLRMRPVYLTSEYEIRIKNDSAFAYLPYYGVAHVAPFDSNEGGIKFAEPVIDYTIKSNKKLNGWDIRFKVKSKATQFDVLLSIADNGNSTITVNSYDRDMISFNGEIKK